MYQDTNKHTTKNLVHLRRVFNESRILLDTFSKLMTKIINSE